MINNIQHIFRIIGRKIAHYCLAVLAALALSACAYDTRVHDANVLLGANDVQGARSLLDEAAESGNRGAMVALVKLRLSGKDPAPISEEAAVRHLIRAAQLGQGQAYGMMLWYYASDDQRARILSETKTDRPAHTRIQSSIVRNGKEIRTPPVYITDIEELAGGPVRSDVLIGLVEFRQEFYGWPSITRELTITDVALLEVDKFRGGSDKYAAARMGYRHLNGRGVAKDPRRAFQYFKRAAKHTPAPQSCYYSAPVGDQKYGTTHCSPTGQPATPGLRVAQKEVCKALYSGTGVRKNLKAARKWCRRAGAKKLLQKIEAELPPAR